MPRDVLKYLQSKAELIKDQNSALKVKLKSNLYSCPPRKIITNQKKSQAYQKNRNLGRASWNAYRDWARQKTEMLMLQPYYLNLFVSN